MTPSQRAVVKDFLEWLLVQEPDHPKRRDAEQLIGLLGRRRMS
jgi:hypothetical protein